MSDDLVTTLRAFGEMPLEGGAVDPLIDVMNSVAHRAADEIMRLRAELDYLRAELQRLHEDYDRAMQELLP